MTQTPRSGCDCTKLAIYSVAILAVLLIGYALMHTMRGYVPAPAVNAKRVDERRAALAEVRANAEKELNGPAVTLKPGVVRLPIERAMELTVQGGKNPAAFRSNLLARVDKATAPPPKAPEKPSEFE